MSFLGGQFDDPDDDNGFDDENEDLIINSGQGTGASFQGNDILRNLQASAAHRAGMGASSNFNNHLGNQLGMNANNLTSELLLSGHRQNANRMGGNKNKKKKNKTNLSLSSENMGMASNNMASQIRLFEHLNQQKQQNELKALLEQQQQQQQNQFLQNNNNNPMVNNSFAAALAAANGGGGGVSGSNDAFLSLLQNTNASNLQRNQNALIHNLQSSALQQAQQQDFRNMLQQEHVNKVIIQNYLRRQQQQKQQQQQFSALNSQAPASEFHTNQLLSATGLGNLNKNLSSRLSSNAAPATNNQSISRLFGTLYQNQQQKLPQSQASDKLSQRDNMKKKKKPIETFDLTGPTVVQKKSSSSSDGSPFMMPQTIKKSKVVLPKTTRPYTKDNNGSQFIISGNGTAAFKKSVNSSVLKPVSQAGNRPGFSSSSTTNSMNRPTLQSTKQNSTVKRSPNNNHTSPSSSLVPTTKQKRASLIPHRSSTANIDKFFMGNVCLSLPEDKYWLSELQCYLRSNLAEAFAATPRDISAPMHGRNKPIALGQVGIRCIHCREASEKGQQAVSYPSLITGICKYSLSCVYLEYNMIHLSLTDLNLILHSNYIHTLQTILCSKC